MPYFFNLIFIIFNHFNPIPPTFYHFFTNFYVYCPLLKTKLMKTIYFYLNDTATRVVNGYSQKFYTVINVPLSKSGNVDEANRKARTIANKLGVPLAGGYFSSSCKPFNLDSNYTVIDCPVNTKIQPYNDFDKFIIGLIESGN